MVETIISVVICIATIIETIISLLTLICTVPPLSAHTKEHNTNYLTLYWMYYTIIVRPLVGGCLPNSTGFA